MSLALNVRRAFGILATEAVEALVVVVIALDTSHTKLDSAITVSAAKAATVAPGGVLMIVIRPGDRPIVTTWRPAIVSGFARVEGAWNSHQGINVNGRNPFRNSEWSA